MHFLPGEKQQEDRDLGLDGRDQQEGEVHQEARQQALLCLQVDFLDTVFTLHPRHYCIMIYR